MPSWPLHVVQVVASLIVWVGPVPLALAFVERLGGRAFSLAERWLAAATFVLFVQVALGLGLGFAHGLAGTPLVVCEAVLLAAGARWWSRSPHATWWPRRALSTIEASTVLVIGTVGLVAVFDLLAAPTKNFDSLAYHLPVMARWVSARSLEAFIELGQVALYPSHFELLGTMGTLPVRQDLFVSLPNLFAWMHWGLVVLVLARRVGAGRDAAAVAAGLSMVVPAVLERLDPIQPDLMLAAVFGTAVVFVCRRDESGRALANALVVACVGLLPGLKLSGPLFVAMLGGLALFVPTFGRPAELIARWRVDQHRGTLVGLTALAVLVGAAWYLRNWIVLGNPLGDLEFGLAGRTLFEGSISRAELGRGALSRVFEVGRAEDWRVLGRVLWEALWLPSLGLVGAAILAVSTGKLAAVVRRERVAFLALAVACAVLYWNTPYSGDNGLHGWRLTPWMEVGLRYGFPVLVPLSALAGAGLDRRGLPGFGLAIMVAAAIHAALFVFEARSSVIIGATLVALAVSTLLLRAPRLARSRRSAGVGSALVILALVVALGPLRAHREQVRVDRFGEIVRVVDERLTPQDVVAAVNTQSLHLASGRDWRRRVVLPRVPEPGRENDWPKELAEQGVTALLLGNKDPEKGSVDDARRIRDFVRTSGNFVLLHDYETRAKDLSLHKLIPRR